jgi:hypothetical protein
MVGSFSKHADRSRLHPAENPTLDPRNLAFAGQHIGLEIFAKASIRVRLLPAIRQAPGVSSTFAGWGVFDFHRQRLAAGFVKQEAIQAVIIGLCSGAATAGVVPERPSLDSLIPLKSYPALPRQSVESRREVRPEQSLAH